MRVTIVTMLFNLAVTTLNFIFGLYFLELTGSAFVFGTLIIIGPVVSLMFTPIMTRIVDYYNHRKILVLSQLISCGSLLIYWAIGSWIDINKITVAYVLMIIIRISEELFIVTFKASVPQITDREHFQQINAAMQSATSIANMAGPIIGGVAYGVFSLRLFILLISATIIISILFTISIQFKTEKNASNKKRGSFVSIVKYVKSHSIILSLVIIAMFVNFFASAITIGLPIIVLRQLGLPKLVYSLLDSLTSVAMVFGGIILTLRKNKSELKIVYRSMFSFTAIILLFGVPELIPNKFTTVILLGVLIIGFGLVVVFANTAMTTYLQEKVPLSKQGGVYSIINALSQLFVPLGALGYGVLFDYFESYEVFITSGIFALIIIASLLLKERRSF